jgi:hypothetical protein
MKKKFSLNLIRHIVSEIREFIDLGRYFFVLSAKLEAEFQSIQVQNEERFEMQSNDLQTLEEIFMTMAYDVDELRRRLDKFAMNGKSVFIFFFLPIILVKQV